MHTSLRSLLALFVLLLASAAWAQQRSPGYLGAELQDVTKEEADKLGWEAPRGAKVVRALPDSPAAEAGLAPGDVITALDGVEVENFAGLRAARTSRAPAHR
jgi:serine protease Do